MRSALILRGVVAWMLLAGTAACRDSTGPESDPTLEEVLQDLMTVETLAAPGVVMMGGFLAPTSGASGSCGYDAASQRFECADVTHGGVTASRFYQLLNAAGAPQSEWGSNVVAIRNVLDLSGTLTLPGTPAGTSISVVAHDDGTLSGLRSTVQELTGTGTSSMTYATPDGGFTSNSTRTTNLVLPDRNSGGRYPTGTITMTNSTEGGSGSSATMTFDGTSRVVMAMTYGSGSTVTCTFDLANPGAPDCN